MGYGRDGGGNDLLLALKGQIDKLKTWISTQGFLTEERDPTVPAWAKASSKPTYTYSEVGAVPAAHDILPQPQSDIPENSNLNDAKWWVPGVWRVRNAPISATIANVPATDGGAKLITITASGTDTGGWTQQWYLKNGSANNVYVRYRGDPADPPSAWTQITMQGNITASTLSALQYVSQSLTSAQKSQALENLGLDVVAVTAANFFSTNPLSSGTYDIRKSGNVVSFYARFDAKPSNGVIKAGYRPGGGSGASRYTILPLYSHSSPYAPVGSVWISGTGAMTFYGAPTSGCYVSGTWVCT